MRTFSLDMYRRLVTTLKAIRPASVAFARPIQRGLLLRVDVDYCPVWAAALARVHAELDVRATFFVQVATPLYNPLTAENRRALGDIVAAGQHVGLHYWARQGDTTAERIEEEFDVLCRAAGTPQRVVAWHNPQGDPASLNAAATAAGFVSAYDEPYVGPDRYVSDSNCARDGDAIAAFVRASDQPTVQVLLHPIIWVLGGQEMGDVLRSVAREKLEQLMACFGQNRVWSEGLGREIHQQLLAMPLFGSSAPEGGDRA